MRDDPDADSDPVPVYGTRPSTRPAARRDGVSDARPETSGTRPEPDEGDFEDFVDELQQRARGFLSDLGIGPDDELPTVASGVDWALYPGTHAGDAERVLAAPSQRELIAENDDFLRSVREAITPSFGLSWGMFGEIARTEPETNDWGGASLLDTVTTGTWRSTAKLSNPLVKMQLVDLVTRMLVGAGFTHVALRNDPAPVAADERRLAALEREFGGRTLRDQVIWSLVARHESHDSTFELTIIDLKHDHSGAFLEAARERAALRGGPMNSVDLQIVARGTLPEENEREFRERAERYERRDPPAA